MCILSCKRTGKFKNKFKINQFPNRYYYSLAQQIIRARHITVILKITTLELVETHSNIFHEQ